QKIDRFTKINSKQQQKRMTIFLNVNRKATSTTNRLQNRMKIRWIFQPSYGIVIVEDKLPLLIDMKKRQAGKTACLFFMFMNLFRKFGNAACNTPTNSLITC